MGRRERQPISPNILQKIKEVWDKVGSEKDTIMLWAACCLSCFFAFLRMGELTVPSDSGYDPMVHLNKRDIAVDHPIMPKMVRITIKQSKTDPFRKGIDLYLGRAESSLCPVKALLNYLAARPLVHLWRWTFPHPPASSGLFAKHLGRQGWTLTNIVDTASA